MDIAEFIKSRRTIRKFSEKPLSANQLTSYVDAARLAPSAANLQPLKYIAVQSKQMADKMFPLLKWAGYLAPKYNPTENERPAAYIVVCADRDISQKGYDMDVGAAVENIILTALADGVGACWIGSIDREEIAKLLGIPQTFYVSCVVALGYPKENPRAVGIKQNIKYYLEGETLCVPKRDIDEVLLRML